MEENAMNGKAFRDANGGKTVQEHKPASSSHPAQRALMTAGAILGAVLLIVAMIAPLFAQSYPNKPIRLILPYPPAGSIDILGRIIGPKLSERLGQPVVPENRPGAGGNVGMEIAAKARPDGYTIVIVSSGHFIGRSLYKKLNYDLIKDLAAISLIAQTHQVVLVHPSLPVKNLKELVEYARANPGKLNFGSTGIGTPGHLTSELLKSLTKINIVHVPYKGAGPALIGLMGGEVQMMVSSGAAAIPHIEADKVRALAVLSNDRARSLPNVPTAKESGIDDLDVRTWFGILAPAGTPRDIVDRLNQEWITIAAMPDTREKMDRAGVEPASGTPEQFAELIKAEVERWAKVVKEAKILPMD